MTVSHFLINAKTFAFLKGSRISPLYLFLANNNVNKGLRPFSLLPTKKLSSFIFAYKFHPKSINLPLLRTPSTTPPLSCTYSKISLHFQLDILCTTSRRVDSFKDAMSTSTPPIPITNDGYFPSYVNYVKIPPSPPHRSVHTKN